MGEDPSALRHSKTHHTPHSLRHAFALEVAAAFRRLQLRLSADSRRPALAGPATHDERRAQSTGRRGRKAVHTFMVRTCCLWFSEKESTTTELNVFKELTAALSTTWRITSSIAGFRSMARFPSKACSGNSTANRAAE